MPFPTELFSHSADSLKQDKQKLYDGRFFSLLFDFADTPKFGMSLMCSTSQDKVSVLVADKSFVRDSLCSKQSFELALFTSEGYFVSEVTDPYLVDVLGQIVSQPKKISSYAGVEIEADSMQGRASLYSFIKRRENMAHPVDLLLQLSFVDLIRTPKPWQRQVAIPLAKSDLMSGLGRLCRQLEIDWKVDMKLLESNIDEMTALQNEIKLVRGFCDLVDKKYPKPKLQGIRSHFESLKRFPKLKNKKKKNS